MKKALTYEIYPAYSLSNTLGTYMLARKQNIYKNISESFLHKKLIFHG
jgi:hypothetical protein